MHRVDKLLAHFSHLPSSHSPEHNRQLCSRTECLGTIDTACTCELNVGKTTNFLVQASSQVDTPALCVSRSRLLNNINTMQKRANEHNVKLRPHCKTHKTIEIAQMQQARGAKGICVAKVDEAVTYAKAGFSDILIAYPLLSYVKLDRLFELSTSPKLCVVFSFIVDSQACVDALERVASRWPVEQKKSIPVYIKIDVGLHRVGMSEHSKDLLNVAKRLSARDSFLDFVGLLSHAGQAYGVKDESEVLAVCEKERLLLLRVKEKIEHAGIGVREISVGSTPTELCRKVYDGITEIRPGNYVFCDMTPLRLGLISSSQVALLVLAQVVSVNDQWIIIDAGSKVLSSDKGAHGMNNAAAYAIAHILAVDAKGSFCGCAASSPLLLERVSEEHGWIRRPEGMDVPLESRVALYPAHSCPVVNLATKLVIVEDVTIETKIKAWNVVARSCSH